MRQRLRLPLESVVHFVVRKKTGGSSAFLCNPISKRRTGTPAPQIAGALLYAAAQTLRAPLRSAISLHSIPRFLRVLCRRAPAVGKLPAIHDARLPASFRFPHSTFVGLAHIMILGNSKVSILYSNILFCRIYGSAMR